MTYSARVLCDSVSPAGHRLTTMEVTLPRWELASLNTYRMWARNSASSRAIPVEKQLERVRNNPVTPLVWGRNQRGMQASEVLTVEEQLVAESVWEAASEDALCWCERLMDIGAHKQIANRLLEPFMWHTVLITATEWLNAINQRCHGAAQPEIRKPFEMLRDAMAASTPQYVRYKNNGWHLPLVRGYDEETLRSEGYDLVAISTARCGRISYMTHEGKRDPDADIAMAGRLHAAGHRSPAEHPARPMTPYELETYRMEHYVLDNGRAWDSREVIEIGGKARDSGGSFVVSRGPTTHFCGPFNGWMQARKLIPGEAVFDVSER